VEERYWWIGLNSVPGVGSITARRLVEAFGTPRRVFRAAEGKLTSVEGVGRELAGRIGAFEVEEAIEREVAACERAGVSVCTLGDEDYPEQLSNLYDPPGVLYIRGTLLASDCLSIAVVGTRRPTAYGRSMTEKLVGGLAEMGFTVVSGLARGIDGLAHQVALEAGGRTLAVLGHGMDRIFPSENRGLAEDVTQKGALLTEFPFGTPPSRHNFPRRNRIISGLALGTLVVEAAAGSGSLITARCALEQGREVLAVPGPVTAGTSRGAHRLIREGTTLVETVDDVIESLPLHIRGLMERASLASPDAGEPEVGAVLAEAPPRVSAEERALLVLIQEAPSHIDRMIEESGLPPSTVSGLLVQLELRGFVARRQDGLYAPDPSVGVLL
jgi:DNA processing protein